MYLVEYQSEFLNVAIHAHSSARHSIKIVVSGPPEAALDDEGALSNSDSRAKITEGMS